MKHFIVMQREYEYDDERYSPGGGTPSKIFTSREDAEASVKELTLLAARSGDLDFLCGQEIKGSDLEEYQEAFGNEFLSDIRNYNGTEYTYLEEAPNMSDWPTEKIELYLSITGANDLFYIVELDQ